MAKKHIFISSVQREFEKERKALADYIRHDALLCRFFVPFIFEELPATTHSAQEAYLAEAASADIYLGIYGENYGYEDAEGVSPTEREYDAALESQKTRLVFIKECDSRNPKEQALISKVEQHVVRKMFCTYEDLRTAVYAALVRYMEENEMLRLFPWDVTYHPYATLNDIDNSKVEHFVELARKKRHFPLQYTPTSVHKILHHLMLASEDGRISNAGLLLFAKEPQRFCLPSEVKCMVFPTTVKKKPMLSYQVFHGSLFEMVDAAVGFVMQHIDAAVGIHTTTSVEVKYEIPIEAVTELIVNACTHRSYESNGSVEVMIFSDRLEVWNPGHLPFGLTVAQLSETHNSQPTNPTLANPVYLAGYIERVGTGTTDVIDTCEKAGLRRPEFQQQNDFRAIIWRKNVTPDVTPDSLDNQLVMKGGTCSVAPDVTPDVTPDKTAVRVKNELTAILVNKHITTDLLAQKFGVSPRTIQRDFKLLRNQYRIEWVSLTPYTGYWNVETL